MNMRSCRDDCKSLRLSFSPPSLTVSKDKKKQNWDVREIVREMGVSSCLPREFLVVAAVMLLQVMVASRVVLGATLPPAKCSRRCGDVDVPYPFGMTNDVAGKCYLGADFDLRCNNDSFNPPKLFYGDMEVTTISLPSNRMTILPPISYDCYDGRLKPSVMWDVSLGATAYTFSSEENVFTAVGCDTLARFSIGLNNFGGCISGCNSLSDVADGSCTGIGCCQGSIPRGVSVYRTGFIRRSKTSETVQFNPCSYFFISQKGNYTFHTSDLRNMDPERSFPVLVDFSIENKTCEEAKANTSSYACVSTNSECASSASGQGYVCLCSQGYEGNPYIPDGCQDINECLLSRQLYPCNGSCTNIPGGYNCTCPEGQHSDDPRTIKCSPLPEKGKLPLILGIGTGVGIGLVIIIGCTIFCYMAMKKRKTKLLRREHFTRNYDLLMQQCLATNEVRAEGIKIFSLTELERATNYFDEVRIVGRGGHGIVYKGLLSDQRVAAIKLSKVTEQVEIIQFINEVTLLSRINHKNVVKLYGCCLESEVPILVYEFISNGTLFDHLHGKTLSAALSWIDRIRIATEIVRALTYLHSAVSMPIFHRDIKSANVLLDDYLTSKLSDFGASKTLQFNQTHVTTAVQGTLGYLDPEYLHTGQLNEKSDVYSLGVILVELLTGEMPYTRNQSDEEKNMVALFLTSVRENRIFEIVKDIVVEEGSPEDVQEIAILAMNCLKLRGEERPTMKEVEMKLEMMVKSYK